MHLVEGTDKPLPATPVQALDFLRHAMWHVEVVVRDAHLRSTGRDIKLTDLYSNPAREILCRAFAHVCMDSDICLYCQNRPEFGRHCHFCGRFGDK